MHLQRRNLLKLLASAGLTALTAAPLRAATRSPNSARGPRIAIIGGGFGGATAARTLRRILPAARITLIEAQRHHVACPFSNLVIAGLRDLRQQTFNLNGLRREGIEVIRARARDVDTTKRTVQLQDGTTLPWDRLILSPGIDIRWGDLEDYDQAAATHMPHAWQAGTQTTLLRRQLEAMPKNGTVVLSVTAAPFRCPPGPYERASLIANYLQRHKPAAKLLILDSNERFSKQPLFRQAWQRTYPGLIEWRGPADDGRVNRVAADTMTLHTDFDTVRGDVINIVPPQQAGAIARRAGVADATGWCPIHAATFESALQPGIHVIGDATIAAPMPKSAFAANAQAKICALQIARLLDGLAAQPTTIANTCYSFTDAEHAISVSGVYHTGHQTDGGKFSAVPGAGGTTPLDAPAAMRNLEALHARDWFRAITREAFAA